MTVFNPFTAIGPLLATPAGRQRPIFGPNQSKVGDLFHGRADVLFLEIEMIYWPVLWSFVCIHSDRLRFRLKALFL